jgi:hypothetical protein
VASAFPGRPKTLIGLAVRPESGFNMVRGMRTGRTTPARVRTTLAAVSVVAIVATGCTISPVKPEATVVISGRALTSTGAPLAHTQVHLYKEADFGEAIVGSVLAVGSLGGICLFPGAPAVCHKGHVATTGLDGSYRFTLKGSDTQGLVGNESTLDLVVADPKGGAAGASTTISFKVASTAVTLPAARVWDALPRVAEGSGIIGLSWTTLPAAYGSGATYSAQLLDPSRPVPMWTQAASGSRAQIDARVLEDRAAAAAVTARTTLTAGVHGIYLSARVAVRPIAGAPPSRHAHCLAVTGTTTLATTPQTVCVATDGDLTSPARLTATNGRVVTGVVIDLGKVRPVSLIVARGVGGMVVVELSTDGVTYHQVSIGSGPTIAVSTPGIPPGSPAARYVRVRAPGGLDESLLTEVSVW